MRPRPWAVKSNLDFILNIPKDNYLPSATPSYEISENENNHDLLSTRTNKCQIYWKTYFALGFYLGLIPFRFKAVKSTSFAQEFHRVTFQRIYAVFIHLLAALPALNFFIELDYGTISSSGFQFQTTFGFTIASTLYHVGFVYVFWKKDAIILTAINKCGRSPVERHSFPHKHLVFAILICSIWSGLSEIPLIKNTWETVHNDIPIWSKISHVFICTSNVYQNLLAQYIGTFVYTSIMMMKELVDDFCTFTATESCINLVLQKYEDLKETCGLINATVGSFLLIVVVSWCPFYVMQFSGLVDPSPVSFIVMFYFISSIGFLSIAAATNKKMDILKEFVQKRSTEIHPSELIVLFNELTPRSTKVGLDFGGLFCINFDFLGTALGILITYTVIAVQMKSTGQDSSVFNAPPSNCNTSSSSIL